MILQYASTRQHSFLIPERFKTQQVSIEGVEVDPWQLHDVPDHFKDPEM